MQEMILQGFFCHQEDLYTLFMPHSSNLPSKEAVVTLSYLVKYNHILQRNVTKKRYSMRVTLIEWLLPKQNFESLLNLNVTQSTQSVIKCSDPVFNNFPFAIAEILACLCLKDSSVLSVEWMFSSVLGKQRSLIHIDDRAPRSWLTHLDSRFPDEEMRALQQAYLEATFDVDDVFEDVKRALDQSEESPPTEHIVITFIKETLLDLVIRDSCETLEICLQNEVISVISHFIAYVWSTDPEINNKKSLRSPVIKHSA